MKPVQLHIAQPESESPFDRFWKAWPRHSRKTSKRKCSLKWKRDKLDAIADHIIEILEALKESADWTKDNGQYIPAPLVWINQERYDCDVDDIKNEGKSDYDIKKVLEEAQRLRELQDELNGSGRDDHADGQSVGHMETDSGAGKRLAQLSKRCVR